jgi:ketosteroid isomerase-like protein
VDAFHAALRSKDTAGALSLLDRGLVVFEFGTADPTVESYAFRHLPFDMDVAVATRWNLETRRLGGEGNERWVLSTYRVTGKHPNGTPIDLTMLETVILRRSGDAFRIVHFHWSTNDPAFRR